MPSLTDVQQQLTEWQNSDATVFLSFSEKGQFDLFLVGSIDCEQDCDYFKVVGQDGHFSSPALSGFDVAFLGPEPRLDKLTRIVLRNSLFEINLSAAQAHPTAEELQAAMEALVQKPN